MSVTVKVLKVHSANKVKKKQRRAKSDNWHTHTLTQTHTSHRHVSHVVRNNVWLQFAACHQRALSPTVVIPVATQHAGQFLLVSFFFPCRKGHVVSQVPHQRTIDSTSVTLQPEASSTQHCRIKQLTIDHNRQLRLIHNSNFNSNSNSILILILFHSLFTVYSPQSTQIQARKQVQM